MRILIADDDMVDRVAIAKQLNKAFKSIEITEADSGTDVLDKLNNNTYDCLLLDYLLPDFDGLDLLHAITDLGFKIPIILITGQGDELIAVQAMKSGAQDYLPKNKMSSNLLSQSIHAAIRLKDIMNKSDYYKEFYDNAPVGFYTTELYTGKFIKVNLFCANMFGYKTVESLCGHSSLEFYPQTRRSELLHLINLNKFVTDFEIEITLDNGSTRWALLTAKIDKQSLHVQGSITDITERKILESKLADFDAQSIDELKEIQEKINTMINS